MDEKWTYEKQWAVIKNPDPHPNITTREEREAEAAIRKELHKKIDNFVNEMFLMAFKGGPSEEPEPELPLLPEPIGAMKIIEGEPRPRRKRRGYPQQAKARKLTNREKRFAADRRRKARRK